MVSTMKNAESMKIPEGYKQTEVGVIPEDWLLSTVGENTYWMSGGTPSRSNDQFWSGKIPWISGSTLKHAEISTSDQFLTAEGVEAGSKMAPLNSTLLLVRGSALHNQIRAGLVVAPVCFNQDVKALVPNASVEPKYLTLYLLGMNNKLLKLVSSAGNSAGVLDTELVQNFKFLKPPIKEQTAIANALSDVDNLIASLETLIAKKSAIKTAAMQQLLTGKKRLPAFAKESEKQGAQQSSELDNTSETAQAAQIKQASTLNSDLYKESGEGLDTKSNQHSDVSNANNKQTAPRPGYKQTELGEIPEDWEVRVLGESLSIMHGRDQKQVECADGKFPILGTGGEMGRTDSYLYNKPSVLIGRKGSINKPRYMDSPFWTVDTLFYSQVSEKFNAKFIFYKFCMIDWMSYNEASGVPSLNSSTIESVMQVFPETREEQTAIANVLSDMDTELEALQQRLNKTKTIKQGMMQELLTGKTRLV